MYRFHSDHEYGWLEVPLKELAALHLLDEVSDSSYIGRRRKVAYLEEECDAPLFMKAASIESNNTRLVNYEKACFIHKLEHYSLERAERLV